MRCFPKKNKADFWVTQARALVLVGSLSPASDRTNTDKVATELLPQTIIQVDEVVSAPGFNCCFD